MQTIKLGARQGLPAFFDMANCHRPQSAIWYGKMFRMGDKAVIYAILHEWRKSNPTRKLSILTYPERNETAYARFINNQMVFESVADELVVLESTGDIPPNLGQPLYTQHLFAMWRNLVFRQPFSPAFRVPVEFEAAALCRLKDWNVPARYAVVAPLFDARYDKHRNVPKAWWQAVITNLSARMPVVVTGDGCVMHDFPAAQSANVFPLYKNNPTPVHSMALVQGAAVYIGGETGLTLWAGLLKTPVVAAYPYWDPSWIKNFKRGRTPDRSQSDSQSSGYARQRGTTKR